MKTALSFCLLFFLLVACTTIEKFPNETPPGKDQTWIIKTKRAQYIMRGERGKFGFVDSSFEAGKEKQYTWYIWGEKEKIVGKQLVIVGVNQKSGQKTKERLATLMTDVAIGATAQGQISLLLPTSGTWRLDAFIDNVKYGETFVEVK